MIPVWRERLWWDAERHVSGKTVSLIEQDAHNRRSTTDNEQEDMRRQREVADSDAWSD